MLKLPIGSELVSNLEGTETKPIDERQLDSEFKLLNRRRRSYDSRHKAMWLSAFVSYFSLSGALLSASSQSLVIGAKVLIALVGTLTLVGAIYLARNSGNYLLTREQKGFLEVYQARSYIKSYATNAPEDPKLRKAKTHLSRVIYAIPVPSKTSALSTNALRGTRELRSFIKRKSIPYLDNPIETSRVIDSLGILAEFLLEPTMDALPSVIK